MALRFNGLKDGFVDMSRAVIQDNYSWPISRLHVKSGQKHALQPVQEIGRLKVALFNPRTWQPTINHHGSANAPCTTTTDVCRITDIVPNWPISSISPPRFLIKY